LSTWNLLDYPSVILPVGQVTVDDMKDGEYEPINERDRENYEMYDAAIFEGMPISLQVVGLTLQEEKLLAVSKVLDDIIGKRRHTLY
jgi:amidase